MNVATATAKTEAAKPSPTWDAVQRYMLRTCGVVLRDDQAYLADSRLASVSKLHGFASVETFVRAATAMGASAPLGAALVDAMTTHETLFFRDVAFWKYLAEQVLPKLAAKVRAGGSARVWSAACSTGQEPYSIAILLEELFPDVAARVEIVASDVSEAAVAQARAGIFTTLEVNRGLSAARLVRYFEQQAPNFRVREHVRARVQYFTHNLLGSRPDPTGCDLVLCRNVLIYFGETDRNAVVSRLHQAATATGVIAVGSTETLRGTPLAAGVYPRAH